MTNRRTTRASGRALKKQKHHATAAQRFFNTPELIHLVLGYLSQDRVDLLTLSLVSKALRAQALKIWVRQLDIPVKDARNLLNFFRANLALLKHVWYLRLRHSHKGWSLSGGRSTSAGHRPLIDLSIYDTDLLCLPPILSQRVVALSIQHMASSKYLAKSSSSGGSSDSDGDSDDHTGRRLSPPRLTFEKVADIIHQAQQGPGLRSFHFTANEDLSGPNPSMARQICHQVVQPAKTLRYLGLDLEWLDFPDVFSKTAFVHLEELFVSCAIEEQLPALEAFLDGTENLRALVIHTRTDTVLSLRQTFPRLRHVAIEGQGLDIDATTSFATRHPNVVNLFGGGWSHFEVSATRASPENPSALEFYPNLAYIDIGSLAQPGAYLSAGRSFAAISLLPSVDMERFLTLLHSNPTAAQRLTFLELRGHWTSTRSSILQILSMLRSQYLPRLAELHLGVDPNWQKAFGGNCSLEAGIARLMAALTSAHSLKVLRLYGREQVMQHKDVLRDSKFPSALQYLVLSGLPDEPQFFRFVSSDPAG
ncbi:hypothetical protein OC846_001430 [Tilletia horrida]|uniref:Uncharacterized protein n=1 Tax=Tilletia horrida TaxID=155126 RepID=A0AAN6GW45_9BASI|nr:hypothetical protein OC845_001527 [Tilletia horrida]KAK0556100.1 hypothetical protein OC846_001430 [Tilletia horrida]KAK0568783.1 hypothetical protein OC861_001635 [Tilletia horrida]